ncbi:RNA-binding motif protein 25 isoform X2 [Henckelia pumila]|uniref:RNA-binding motif protein 25 isoform X2 n=2 Tax=Henckelia pumila TaxID=405737 RepID=UPI003C6E1307
MLVGFRGIDDYVFSYSALMIDYLGKGWKASLETTEYPNSSTPFLLTLLKVDCSFAYVNQGAVRYPSPYAPMLRPGFPPRPLVGVVPALARPPVIGIRGPLTSPVVRQPVIPSVVVTEKPQTIVYVGKISSTVENDFMLSLLQLCGPVKSWKRVQDPTNGTLKGFGFCEFEFAEGVLRAMRLLNKLNVDGQELMLKVNQATSVYLEHYVKKKTESSKTIQGSETEVFGLGEPTASVSDKNEAVTSSNESVKPSSEEEKKDDGEKLNKENPEDANFGIVTDEDMEADREALEKLTSMLDERLKNKPLPPPPPPLQTAVDGPDNSNSEQPSGSRDGESETDVAKHDAEDKNEDEKTGESKLASDHDRAETGSPDRSRRQDKSRDRDRESRREKEKELERYEREREQERAKREKDREYKSREEERRYKVREKDWETREREREHWRKREREKEKEKSQERKWEIMDQERDSDDGYGKKRKYRTSDEERKRRQREKEEDVADRLREEEEIVESEMKAAEELLKKQQESQKIISAGPANGHENTILPNDASYLEDRSKAVVQTSDLLPSGGIYESEVVLPNGVNDETVTAATDERQAPTRKLGFGLSGSGKRAAIPSVFNADEDEDAHKEKKMRPLVPIDYSTEEQQAVKSSMSEGPSSNMVAATDVKRISTMHPKEEKVGTEKEKGRRYHEKSSQRDRGRYEEETSSTREDSRKDHSDRERANKLKTLENQKLLDAKQLIDAIPKTKDELFSYEINWVIYEQNALHERMRPWISKKITDFLGEEEVTLVDYIVSSTQEHINASEMFERLQSILDDEAEMFVLKMWRMLIFEIKKVETGLATKPRT